MGVPFVRTTFDIDEMFALELGFEGWATGYFYKAPKPPPSAVVPSTKDTPWLSLHTCLNAAKAGDRQPLTHLAGLLDPGQDEMFRLATIELLADAADDRVIAWWRDEIVEDKDADFTYDLCCGLLRRGLLRDIPLVLEAYVKHSDFGYYYYLPTLIELLLGPLDADAKGPIDAYQHAVSRRCTKIGKVFHDDCIPVFRGGVFSVGAVAECIVAGIPPKNEDLRCRFEGSTGIDCTSWFVPRRDPDRAAEEARRFLASEEVNRYQPGRLYFFGHEIELRS
jgi:hypothetical protein